MVQRPIGHIIGYFGDNVTGQFSQSTEEQWLVNQVEGQSHQAQGRKHESPREWKRGTVRITSFGEGDKRPCN